MRVPTYIDSNTNRLSEIPEGDFLSTVGNGIAEGHTALSGDTPTVSLSGGGSFSLVLSGNTTFTFADAPATGASGFSVAITQDAIGSGYTVTWPAEVKWPGGTAPELTATADKSDAFVFTTSDGGTTYTGLVAGKDI